MVGARGDRRQDGLAVRVDARGDAEIGELRHELADRIVQIPQTPLVQHHHRHAGDRLGLRADAEDGVERHRLTAQRAVTERLGVDDATVTGQQGHPAGDLAAVDHGLHVLVELLEPFGAEALLLRLALRQGQGRSRGDGRAAEDAGHQAQRAATQLSPTHWVTLISA
jgi:hypothetical protein